MGRPTITDVAAASGLSVSTVNRVLNGKHNVREETVHKVYRAAEAIGYHAAPLIKYRLQEDLPEVRLGVLLQKEDQRFYQNFAAAIKNAVSNLSHVRARVEITYAGSQDPDEQAELLLKLGARTQALAATAVDHHGITAAVQRLKARNIPVYALLNDFAQGVRHNYVGLNNLKIGRLAAWTISKAARRPGKVAIFVGGLRWHGHQLRETGFRAYFREYSPEFTLLETLVNLETRQVTYEATLDLLHRHPDLRGIFVAGGGMEGAIQALREMRQPDEVALVVNELTDLSATGLQEHYVSLIDATPLDKLCTALVVDMVTAALDGATETPGQIFLQPDLYVPESL
jgi:LacI family transcriptional regulator, galactose operon repressor